MGKDEKAQPRLTFEISSTEELAAYAFDQKVEEAGTRVLRTRLYPLIAVITAMLGSFGIGLAWWVNKVEDRATALNASVTAAEARVKALDDEIAAFQNAANTLRTKSDELDKKREQLDEEMKRLTRRGQEVEVQSLAAITGAAAAHNSGLTAREMAAQAQETLAKVVADINRRAADLDGAVTDVKRNAEESRREISTIQSIRQSAEQFSEAVDQHRDLVASTVVDTLSLRSHDSSQTVVPNLLEGGSFTIRFETTSIEKKSGFDVFYSVNDGKRERVKVSRDDIRRQIPIIGTDGQYQFMMEFIFSTMMAPDFVSIRVSGVPQAKPRRAVTARGLDSTLVASPPPSQQTPRP